MGSFFNFLIQNRHELLIQLLEHIGLTFGALVLAILIGIPLGIYAHHSQKMRNSVLGSVGIIQTIPSLALLGFLLPLFGIGPVPAIIALFLYALLPIVRNTFTGVHEIDASVIDAARGMGMSDVQIMMRVRIPLAMPVIFAGIRTATVINVGVATLCALIGAGGLGEFIFRGIALNNVTMILAGAFPAALLALALDLILDLFQKNLKKWKNIIGWGMGATVGFVLIVFVAHMTQRPKFILGLTPEFTERTDGYHGLVQAYDLHVPTIEMNSALLYQALKNKRVDAIVGYSTDGRIKAFKLRVLDDDKNYFPPYYCAPLVRDQTLKKYPQLRTILNRLAGKLDNTTMQELNYQVDQLHKNPADVARDFLKSKGFQTTIVRTGAPDIVIGGKNFTEQFILDWMFKTLIENNSSLTVGLQTGLAGTKIVFDALNSGEIDLYPEYTGTGLYVILKADSSQADSLLNDQEKVYNFVKKKTEKRYNLSWLQPLGFNNTYALMMRESQARSDHIRSISDLQHFVKKNH